jgi:hypothetical protein
MRKFTVLDHAGTPQMFKADSYSIDAHGHLHLHAEEGSRDVASFNAPGWKAIYEDEAAG